MTVEILLRINAGEQFKKQNEKQLPQQHYITTTSFPGTSIQTPF